MIPPAFLTEVKAWLGASGTGDDAWITAEIEKVLAAMRGVTGRWLYPRILAMDSFQAPGDWCWSGCGRACPPVRVAITPAGDLSAVVVDGVTKPLGDYLLWRDGTLIYAATRRPVPVPAPGYISVAYQGGYADLPGDLKAVVFDLVGVAWQAADKGPNPGGGVSPLGGRVQIADVGSIDQPSGTPGTPTGNPFLGVYAAALTPYIDLAVQIAVNECRVTEPGGLPP